MISKVVLKTAVLACVCHIVFGENKRLVCKTTDTEFGDNYLNTFTTFDTEAKDQTDANYLTLNASIESITGRVIKKMQTLEGQILKKLQTAIVESRYDLEGLQDALILKGKRYWALIPDGGTMNYKVAEMLCQQKGGRPADIIENADLKVINEHIVATMSKNTNVVSVWLGMRFDYETKEIRYFDGDTAPQLPWAPGHPSRSKYTGILLKTQRDAAHRIQGLFLGQLSVGHAGVLCQK